MRVCDRKTELCYNSDLSFNGARMNLWDLYMTHHREPDWKEWVDFMKENHIPVTRENFLKLMYMGNPPEWSAELEEELPPNLQDWTHRTFGTVGSHPKAETCYLSSQLLEEFDKCESWT